MAGPDTFTPNLHLTKIGGDRKNWNDTANSNMTMLDGIISAFFTVSNMRGIWANSVAYAVGDAVVDETTAVVWVNSVAHTSSMLPTTFAEARTANPTYWAVYSAPATTKGAWTPATAYSRNDFVLADGTKYAFCLVAHTSGATFAADLALGYWSVIIDLSVVGSLVLPVLSGAADANKAVMTNSAGNAYVISDMAALAALLSAAGLATLVSPAFTGTPTAPTQTAENNSTRLATTAYADIAVRSLVIRRQTFTANGTYTPHAKMLYCDIECWGGGGGGGGASNSSVGFGGAGAGGGAGGYSRTVASKATIGASQTVTIGALGTAGTNAPGNGGNGGDTSLGTICVAKGGFGGTFGTSGALSIGGEGGIAGTGDIAGAGMSGGGGLALTSAVNPPMSGLGGSSSIGSGGKIQSVGVSTTGAAASGKGAGGGGGISPNTTANAAGGAGTAGFVVITEFCYG